MGKQHATAQWKGTLKEGSGSFNLPKGKIGSSYTFATRFEDADGTNPEELVGAAISSCYAMFLSALLTNNGFTPTSIDAKASVTLERDDTGPCITEISLDVEAKVADIDNDAFQAFVQEALQKCPISRLYASVKKDVNAALLTVAS